MGGTTTQVLKRSVTFTANVSEANMSAVNVFSVNVPTAGAAPAPPAIADSPTPALPLLSIVPSEGSAAWTSSVAACFVGAPCFHVSLFYGTITPTRRWGCRRRRLLHRSIGRSAFRETATAFFRAGVYARATAQREGDGRLTNSSKASKPGIKPRLGLTINK